MKRTRREQPKLYSVTALSRLTGADRKTIDKAIARAQIKPGGRHGGRALYELEPIQDALAAKPDKTLKDEKLAEEIRKLRILNDEREGKLINRATVATSATQFVAECARLLTQALENEFPALVQGLDIAGCRVKGKQLNDRIRAEIYKLCDLWPE